MKKVIIGSVCLFLVFTAKSQSSLLEHTLPELSEGRNYEKMTMIADTSNNRMYAVLLSKTSLHCIKIAMPACTVESEITGNIQEGDDILDYYGATIHNDTLSLLYKTRYKEINLYTFIFGPGSFLSSNITAENKKEKILNAFIWQNRSCYLKQIIKKNDDERFFQINIEGDDGFFKANDFHFPRDKSLEQRKGSAFITLETPSFFGKNYQVMDIPATRPRYPNVLNYVKYHTKQYIYKSKLIITEDYNDVTELFEMDMLTKQSSFHLFAKKTDTDGPEWADCSNSFVLADNLFQVELSPTGLLVSAHNLNDTSLQKIFHCNEQVNDFAFQSNFISENHDGGFLDFRRDDKMLDGVKIFLSKLKNNPAGIIAEEVNNSIKLTVGALKVNAGSGPGYVGPNGMYGSFGSGPSLSTNAIYFNSYLDANTLKCIPADTLTGNIYDKLEDIFGKPQEKVNQFSIINFRGPAYFCYYNQGKNKIYMLKSQL